MAGLGFAGAAKPMEIQARFRAGWVQYAAVTLGGAGGIAVVLAVFNLLQKQPADGFKLLVAWGPYPFIILVGLAIVGKFLSRLSDSLQTTFSAVVESSQQSASAHTETAKAVTTLADATTRLAEQGGHSADEVRRLAIFAAQEFPSVYERFDRTDAALGKLTGAVTQLLERGRDGN